MIQMYFLFSTFSPNSTSKFDILSGMCWVKRYIHRSICDFGNLYNIQYFWSNAVVTDRWWIYSLSLIPWNNFSPGVRLPKRNSRFEFGLENLRTVPLLSGCSDYDGNNLWIIVPQYLPFNASNLRLLAIWPNSECIYTQVASIFCL